MDPSGGTPGPVKKKANSAGVSPDKDDSPTLEQMEPLGALLGGRESLLGGREGKREVVIGRRGKPWVPWEQLWQVSMIKYNIKEESEKITNRHKTGNNMLQFGKNLDEKETLFGCTLGLSRFNSLAQIQHSKSLLCLCHPQ